MQPGYTEIIEIIEESSPKRGASLTADIGPFLLVARKIWQPEKFLSCTLIDPTGQHFHRVEVTPELLEDLMDSYMTFKIGWPEFLKEYREQYDTPSYIVTLDTLEPELEEFKKFLKAHEIEVILVEDRPPAFRVTYQGTEADLKEMIHRWWDDAYLFKFIGPAPGL